MTDALLVIAVALLLALLVLLIIYAPRLKTPARFRIDPRLIDSHNLGEPGADVPQDRDWRPDPVQGVRDV